MFKMTKADALARQATQVDHYAALYGDWVRAAVAEATRAAMLPDDGLIDVVEVNRYIPRGGAIEAIIERHGYRTQVSDR
jgi:hypothetical protein